MGLLLAVLGLASCSGAAATPAGSPAATATLTPLAPREPTAIPVPIHLPLTESGCCSRPWWSADGSRVLFVDDPPGDRPLGVYSVAREGGEGQLDSTAISADTIPDSGPSGAASGLGLPTSARNVRISPDGGRVAWTEGSTAPVSVDLRRRSIWVVDVDEATRTRVLTVIGGDLIGWAGDSGALIATGGILEGGPVGVWRVPLDGSAPSLLVEGTRPRSAELSPSGGWVVFYLAFQEDPSRNGVWIVDTNGGAAQSMPGLASYRWGREGQLLFIPYQLDRDGLSLVELDTDTGETRLVFDGSAFPGGIASNDWAVSPTGDHLVYRSAEDGSLWVVSLPPGG